MLTSSFYRYPTITNIQSCNSPYNVRSHEQAAQESLSAIVKHLKTMWYQWSASQVQAQVKAEINAQEAIQQADAQKLHHLLTQHIPDPRVQKHISHHRSVTTCNVYKQNSWCTHPEFSQDRDERIKSIFPCFHGLCSYLAHLDWIHVIPVTDKPINYLEIGVLHGANLISVASSYAQHPKSQIHAIDSFCSYSAYKAHESGNYDNPDLITFKYNMKRFNFSFTLLRGYSHRVVCKLSQSYDMIYVDGNPLENYVYNDMINAWRKLKNGGWMIVNTVHIRAIEEFTLSYLNGFRVPSFQSLYFIYKH